MTSDATASPSAGPPRRAPSAAQSTEIIRVLGPDGGLAKNATRPRLSRDGLASLYRALVRARVFDEAAAELCADGKISSHVGARGEEAAIVGSAHALQPEDWVFPSYRDIGGAFVRGMTATAYADHLFGNADDPCLGRQMPDHWSHRPGKLASVSSLGGTHITHAVGFAWAAKLRGEPLAVLTSFGDAATSAGGFHNGMNFAGVFDIPCVFFCRSVGWAGATPSATQTASESIAAKGIAYEVPALRCDGNDVLAVVQAVDRALARARAGEGATLVEAVIVSPSEETRALDPLRRMRLYLQREQNWSEAQERALWDTLSSEAKTVFATAEKKPAPPPETLFRDVFAEVPPRLAEQARELDANHS